MIQAKRDKLNIKKLNPPGVFKKSKGKRELGEKFDSKFYPDNYKKDVLYMNYNDFCDNLYMENKGINFGLRSYKNINKKKIKDKENNYKSSKKIEEDNNELMKKYVNKQFTFKQNYENNNENNFETNTYTNKNQDIVLNQNNIQEAELKNNYINNINEQENKDIINNQNISNNDENNININLEYEDIRLNYVMEKLGLESLISIFEQYHMSFNDILFLTQEDLDELGLKIFQKNRLIAFIQEYSSIAKNYSLEEIKTFFEENKIYNISNSQK